MIRRQDSLNFQNLLQCTLMDLFPCGVHALQKLGAVGANTLVGLKPWVIACGSSQCTSNFGEFVLNRNFGLVLFAGHLIC